MVYDVINEKFFYNILKWMRKIEEYVNEDVEKIFIVNKCDFEEKRRVMRERGEVFVQNYCICYVEISVFLSLNIDYVFIFLM